MPRSRTAISYISCRRWTAAHARAALSALARSGLSPAAFAARRGLDVNRLYRWRERLGASGGSPHAAPAPAPAFIELPSHTPEPIEILLRSGHTLRVAESVSTAALRRMVEVLEARC